MSDRIEIDQAERLDRLFRRYHSRLLAFAATQTRDAATAEDIASETWLRAAVSLPQLRADDDSAYSWLRSITRRAAVDHYRLRSASETPRDWTDAETSLPAARSAEDVALAVADLLAVLEDRSPEPAPVIPLPRRQPRPVPAPRPAAVAALAG